MIFDDKFFRQLAALRFIVQKMLWLSGGEETSAQRGGRLEFNDYRNYTPGDETRYIDWNVFGRTERLFVKEFALEEELPLYLILDKSTSIKGKSDYARKLAAALGYVALISGHRLTTIAFSGNKLISTPVFQREDQIFELFKFLEQLPFNGETNLADSLKEINSQATSQGLVILISDLFDTTGAEKELISFAEHGLAVVVLHLLSNEEENPSVGGWLKLKDCETASTATMVIDQNTINYYRTELTAFLEQWRDFCLKNNLKYFHITDNQPLETPIIELINHKIIRRKA